MAISKIDSKALTDSSVVDADIADGTITSAKLAGSVANAKLQNSTVTINGTAVALGASASLAAISWQAVKTAAFNAVAGEGYFVNTTSGVITVTLPASPSIGDTIAIKDYAGTYATNNLTIARNGKNIQGVANDSLISTNRASLILVFVDDTKGWVYTVESNVDFFGPRFISATGGTVTESGDYKIHSFTGDGCFVVSDAGNQTATVDYLAVGGGGSGGVGAGPGAGAGGGAGGFRTSNELGLPAPLTSPLSNPTGVIVTSATYPITIGSGGSGVAYPSNKGNDGSNSVFSTITSTGGGGGATSPAPLRNGNPGGSGGGAGAGSDSPTGTSGTVGSGNTPPVSPSQGNNGGQGNAGVPGGAQWVGGGGGGASAVGGTGDGTISCNTNFGGAGSYISPSFAGTNGTSGPVCGVKYFSGGGGGGAQATGGAGAGGAGGGTAGANGPSTSNGTTNTGGGSGAAGANSGSSGNGGSGIFLIRYKFQ